ncbi:uncharacterized protein LOC126845831 [Adelges cooleyi]|uniref:uncharacterized protein LOC126845831 n=1 Tax=Adelges cooleyi TaxID=133065 RepID=UPI0021801065|nr:uncharacterized protein LOC126845831 [Adelges cooleyi]
MYLKCILYVTLFYCVQNGTAVTKLEMLENYFDKNGLLPYDLYVSFVRQNYNSADYYKELVTEIGPEIAHGINKETFTWAISRVDTEVPCPPDFNPKITAGSSQHANLLEKSKGMDKDFDGEYFDRTK